MGVSQLQKKKQPYYLIAFRILLVLVWTQETVLRFVRAVIERVPVIGNFSDIFIPACIILALVVAIPWFLKNLKGTDILFYLGIVVLVLGTIAIFDNNAKYLEEEWWQILIAAAPFYFIGVGYSYRNCSRDLFWCSAIGVAVVFMYQVFKLSRGRILEEDDMDTAYNLLPSVMYLIYYASYRKKRIFWLVAGAASLVMFVFGTRGPILCIIVYICALVMNKTLRSRKMNKILLISVVLIGVIVIFSNEKTLMAISDIMSGIFGKLGFSTRIFDFFSAGQATVSVGRDILTEKVLYYIVENPIVGYGFTGDRYLLGVYCHNLILELWCHFGVIVGSLLLLMIMVLVLVTLVKCCNNPKIFKFALMLSCMIFVKLMVSGSYTIEPYFYFMLGAFVSIIRKCVRYRSKEDVL